MKSRSGHWLKQHVGHDGEDCLIWPYGRDSQGYGRAKLKGHGSRLAHQIMCEMAHGPAPFDNAMAMHTCGMGHTGCVNPRHLAWGTAMQNNMHKCLSGNQPKGEAIGKSVLTTEAVLLIRAMAKAGRSQRYIARCLSVSHGTVQAVLEGRTWSHVDKPNPYEGAA